MAFEIDRLKKRVAEKYPWFGGIMAGLEWEATDRIKRTASDGDKICYNEDFLAALMPQEQLFYISHEICHVAFDHIARSRGKDRIVWNDATDAVINQLLKGDGIPIPEGAVDHPEAAGLSAEAYYEELLEHKLAIELVEGNMNRPDGSGGGSTGDQEHRDSDDDHSLWDEAVEQRTQEEEEHREELLKELDRIKDIAEEMEQEETEETREESDDKDEDENALVERKTSAAGDEVIDKDQRHVEEIGYREPLIDWRLILRETTRQGVDWTFTNAIIDDGLVRPSLEEIPTPETEIVVDTSWSVDEELLRNFLRECKNILKYSKLKIGCFDTRFYGFQDIRRGSDIDEMILEGGGGTDLEAATGAFTYRVDNKIVFTDGEAPLPEEPVDAIWMVYGDREISPPGGKVIHIRQEDLLRRNRR